jgi:hypothetical protein
MIKLKPIAEQVLNEADEADEAVTWGDVRKFFNAMKDAQRKSGRKQVGKDIAITSLKKAGIMGAKWAVNAVTLGTASPIMDILADHGEDVGSFLLNLGKEVSTKELKNPKGSEFKKMTGTFWKKIKLTPEVSILLDDQIEKQFIDQVILPKLNTPGSDSEPLPNMDELLGKWLNDQGLKAKADIHFTGASGNL